MQKRMSSSDDDELVIEEEAWDESHSDEGDGVTIKFFPKGDEDSRVAGQPLYYTGCWRTIIFLLPHSLTEPHYYLYLDNVLSSWVVPVANLRFSLQG